MVKITILVDHDWALIFCAQFILHHHADFFGLLSFLALKEFLSIVHTRLIDRSVIFLAYLSIPIQYYWLAMDWYGMFIIFIPVYVFLYLPMQMVLLGEHQGFIRAIGILHWGVMLTVFCMSHLAHLLTLPVINLDAGDIGLILYLIFLTELNDVAQYVCGKIWGEKKITPKISPNKTWIGFFGGMVTVMIFAALLATYLTPLSTLQGFIAGILIALSGFIGDLVMSAIKRDLRIKDTGMFIPGHGGLLDRLDSLLFTSPLFFHYLYFLHY